jgi:hypothetical protein
MNKKQKKGISLIILVITIIVIIILAGSIILSLSQNNPISQASKAVYLSDLRNFQTELDLYETKQFVNNLGSYNPALLQANGNSITYNGIVDTNLTVNSIITSLSKAPQYNGQFEIINGKLIFEGTDTTKQSWATEAGVDIAFTGEPIITITLPANTSVAQGTDVVYTVGFSSNSALTTVNLTGKVELVNNLGVALPVQPVITIGTVSGNSLDLLRQVNITVKTNTLASGIYKLRIKPGSVTNANNISVTQNITSLNGFNVDTTPPVNPTMLASPSGWTIGNVTVTITYPIDSAISEYSTNGTIWNVYTLPVVVTSNSTTIYARATDDVGNQSGQSTLTVANIDRIAPTVTASSGTTTANSITVNAVASDASSGINTSSYQYSSDNGTTWTATMSATSYTFNSLTVGTYQCKVKVVDNVGNIAISPAVGISTLLDEYLKFNADDIFASEATTSYFSGYSWNNTNFFGSSMTATTSYDNLTGYIGVGSSYVPNTVGQSGWTIGNTATTRTRSINTIVTNGAGWYGYNSTTYTRTKVKAQSSYIQLVTGGTYPTNGLHTDGFWYIKVVRGSNTHIKLSAVDMFGTEATTSYFSGYSWNNTNFFGSSMTATTSYDNLTGYIGVGSSYVPNTVGQSGWTFGNGTDTRTRSVNTIVTNGAGWYGYNSTTYTRSKIKAQGDYIQLVTGSYPSNGLHTDGYWYILL